MRNLNVLLIDDNPVFLKPASADVHGNSSPSTQPGDQATVPQPGESPSIAKPLLVMLALMVAVGVTGLQLYRLYDRETREDAQDLVTAVAWQKAQALEIWLNQRASEASSHQYSLINLRTIVAQLVVGHDASAALRISEALAMERVSGDTALLLDVQGVPLGTSGQLEHVSAALRDRVRSVAATGTAQMHFLHRDEDLPGSPIFLDYLVPLAAPGSTGKRIAVLVVRHDPERFLYPFVQTWPGQSRSAETLLVRAEGERVLFLNNLRHRADAAFRLTRPRTELTLPAVQTVFGLPRLDKNFDYRGSEVIYDQRPIGGTGWHLVANIDAAEILHSVRKAATAALGVTLALILLVGASAIVYWRQQLRLFAASHHASEIKREALSKHLDLMSRHANDAIFLYDEAGRILEVNERAVERYGYPRDELIGMSANQLRAPGDAHRARAEAQRADEAGSHIYETLHRRKDGDEFPVEASLRVVDVEGRRLTQGIVRDTTERKRAHDALLGEKNFIAAALDSLPGLFYVIDDQGRFLRWNKNFERVSGYSSEEISHLTPVDFFAGPDKAIIAERIGQVFVTGEATAEVDFVTRDQTRIPYFFTGKLVEIEHKPCLVGMGIDITERKRAEARVVRLASLKDALSRVNHAIVHAKNEQSLFEEICAIMVERAGCDYAGIGIPNPDSDEIRWVAGAGADATMLAQARRTVRADQPEGRGPTGTAIREHRHVISQDFLADPSTAAWHEIGRTLGIGSSATFPIMRAGVAAGVINVHSRAPQAFDDEVVGLLDEAAQDVSFALDNLDRERARRKAKARATELLSIVNRSPAVFIKFNPRSDRPVELVSDNIAQFGYSPEELVSGRLKINDIIIPEDLTRIIEERKRAEREGQSVVVREYRVVTRDGQIRWVEDHTWIQRDTAGRITQYQALLQDITVRRVAETELRAAEEQFRGLVEQSISGIFIIQDGRFAYVNARAAEIFGYVAPEELVGREPADFVAQKDRGLVAENIRRRLAGEVKSIAYTFTGLRKDGTTVEIGAHGSLATYHGRPAIISAAQDITERKRAEDEVQRHLAELRQAMMATVRVASTMSEMRDPYTSGHERRVGELSAAIGTELCFSEDRVEGLRVAGYLHDLGKIMVPSEILSKPGKISPIEFALMKEHARQGYEILKEVNFPWPVALVALQHHERMNGTGYPQGLKGDEIILEARILAVADTVEAMGSHRPYRPGLGIETALAEIEQHRGTRYDPQAADACLRLFREKGYRLPA